MLVTPPIRATLPYVAAADPPLADAAAAAYATLRYVMLFNIADAAMLDMRYGFHAITLMLYADARAPYIACSPVTLILCRLLMITPLIAFSVTLKQSFMLIFLMPLLMPSAAAG